MSRRCLPQIWEVTYASLQELAKRKGLNIRETLYLAIYLLKEYVSLRQAGGQVLLVQADGTVRGLCCNQRHSRKGAVV